MPDPESFDLDFRPRSYWGPQSLETVIGSRVKGELRRQVALIDLKNGWYDPEFAAESLPELLSLTRIGIDHWFMGGEYLPDLMPNEVEIARVVMKSALLDVVSIRARRTKHRIIYRIVDEEDPPAFDYHLTRKTSIKPLSMRELIEMIDNAVDGGLVGIGRDWVRDDGYFGWTERDAKRYHDFETAWSAFYPELENWYDEGNKEWLERELQSLRQRIDDGDG